MKKQWQINKKSSQTCSNWKKKLWKNQICSFRIGCWIWQQAKYIQGKLSQKLIYIYFFFKLNTYCLRWTSKTILIASSSDSLIGVAFNQISHRIFRAPTVHDLLCRIIRVGDVRPCYISEIFALFEGFHRFTDLKSKK